MYGKRGGRGDNDALHDIHAAKKFPRNNDKSTAQPLFHNEIAKNKNFARAKNDRVYNIQQPPDEEATRQTMQ